MALCYATKKESFPTKLEADLAISEIHRMSSKHRKQRYRELPTRSYRCEFCRSWHYTSQAKSEENESRLTQR